jgi:ABC-type Co2+ transport system permease subunit
MMGILAAFIFAAQAINFPVAAGSSGHLVGGALAAVVMGPWAATLIMTAVIAVQGLLFQDGGLLVMGWNILNMGVFAAFTGYAAYTLVFGWCERAARPTGGVLPPDGSRSKSAPLPPRSSLGSPATPSRMACQPWPASTR